MGIKNDLLGGGNWLEGEKLTALDINDTFNATVAFFTSLFYPAQVYTGTDFNSSRSYAQTGTDSQSHILSTPTGLQEDQVKIEVTYKAEASIYDASLGGGATALGNTTFQIETSELGLATWSDTLPITTTSLAKAKNDGIAMDVNDTDSTVATISFFHILTANEKINGLDIRLSSTSLGPASRTSASFTNLVTNLYYK